jgi:hypothetical protein
VSMFRGDASDIFRLSDELADIGAKTVPVMRAAMKEAGDVVAAQWRANATRTAGQHGKHYPKSITADLMFDLRGVSVDIGPDSSKKQGGMGRGFEFGSINQPPHLDGIRALDAKEAAVERIVEAAVSPLFR